MVDGEATRLPTVLLSGLGDAHEDRDSDTDDAADDALDDRRADVESGLDAYLRFEEVGWVEGVRRRRRDNDGSALDSGGSDDDRGRGACGGLEGETSDERDRTLRGNGRGGRELPSIITCALQ